jgi:hypothetical protein
VPACDLQTKTKTMKNKGKKNIHLVIAADNAEAIRRAVSRRARVLCFEKLEGKKSDIKIFLN